MIQDLELPKELLERLDTLAAKVGTTVEHLWPALVQFHYYRGVGCVAGVIALLVATVVIAVVAKRLADKENEDVAIPVGVLAFCLAVASVCLGGFAFYEAVPMIAAPEGAAVRALFGK